MRIGKLARQFIGWVLLALGVLTLPVVLPTLNDSVAGWLRWFTVSEQFFIRLMGGGGVAVSITYMVITAIGLLLIYLPRKVQVPPPPEEEDGGAAAAVRIRQLEPRAIYVERRADGGYDEHSDRPQINRIRFATVASFRNEPIPNAVDVFVHARITYYDRNGNEHQRVDDGCWLGADFNHADMPVGATREVILVIGNGEPVAIQDNRQDAGQPRDPSPRAFAEFPTTAVVDLIVRDRRDDAILGTPRFRYRLSFNPAGVAIA